MGEQDALAALVTGAQALGIDLTAPTPVPSPVRGRGEPDSVDDETRPTASLSPSGGGEGRERGQFLTDVQLAAFARYRELLLDWNTRINLTAIEEPAEVLTRHFLDSLTCLLAVPTEQRQQSLSLLDVGSGAGFPGLPLAIVCPHWHVTLLEATGKKVRFLEAVIAALNISNAQALHGRAEEVAHQSQHPGQRGRYQLVTARAVAALPTLLEYCAPFVRRGGLMLFPKKGELAQELAAGAGAAATLGAELLPTIPVTVPPLDDGRVIVVARQQHPCHTQYPRPAGAPVKHPLG